MRVAEAAWAAVEGRVGRSLSREGCRRGQERRGAARWRTVRWVPEVGRRGRAEGPAKCEPQWERRVAGVGMRGRELAPIPTTLALPPGPPPPQSKDGVGVSPGAGG